MRSFILFSFLAFTFNICLAQKEDIFLAIEYGDVDIVAEIIDRDSNVNKSNQMGIFPLVLATKLNQVEMVEMLLKKGARVDKWLADGSTSLHIAAINGNYAIAKLLIKNGASLNVKTIDENLSPLFFAIMSGSLETVKLLVESGAGLSFVGFGSVSPVFVALDFKKVSIADYFLEYGFDINQQDDNGNTMAIWAIMNGKPEFFSYLLEHNADLTLKNIEGKTALDVATQLNHKHYIKLINRKLGNQDSSK